METKEADVSQHLLHSISDNAWKVYCLSLIRIQTFMAIGFILVNTGVLSVKKPTVVQNPKKLIQSNLNLVTSYTNQTFHYVLTLTSAYKQAIIVHTLPKITPYNAFLLFLAFVGYYPCNRNCSWHYDILLF